MRSVVCPHCDGDGEFIREHEYQYLMSEDEVGEYGLQTESIVCWTCGGSGKIREMELVMYRLRGGPSPVEFRGYA